MLERLQSEKPRIAKKAEENKMMAKPTPAPTGEYMAVARKQDEAVAAKLGSEPVDGVGNGVYSEFLHQWCQNIVAVYHPPPGTEDCRTSFTLVYENGHVDGIEPADSCSAVAERAFHDAIEEAPRPPMPTSFAGHQIPLIFYGGKG